jgi:hypothetical protein
MPLAHQAMPEQHGQEIAQYFPLFPTYTGIAGHGSKINGDFDDNTSGCRPGRTSGFQ